MTRDGGINKFHEKCDGFGPTITLMKSTENKIFGGYTDIEWKSKGDEVKGKGKSFLFFVNDDKSMTKLKCIKGNTEVYHDANQLTFGVDRILITDQRLKENKCKFYVNDKYYQMADGENTKVEDFGLKQIEVY